VEHFVRRLGSVDAVREHLVWLPTWHQARLICLRLGVGSLGSRVSHGADNPEAEVIELYNRILFGLREANRSAGTP
jgi:hypothetical protein